jgi:hypothetical protein
LATAERVFWETVTVVAFLVLLAGTVLWFGSRAGRHRERLEREFAAKMATAGEEHRELATQLQADHERRAREGRLEEAKTAFRAFEAGVRSAVAARWGNYTKSATSHLLEDSRITFAHILTPGGSVLASSDDELARAGRIDERGDWARASDELRIRQSETDGIIELAGPIKGADKPVAFLWFGYDTESGAPPGSAQAATVDQPEAP